MLKKGKKDGKKRKEEKSSRSSKKVERGEIDRYRKRDRGEKKYRKKLRIRKFVDSKSIRRCVLSTTVGSKCW